MKTSRCATIPDESLNRSKKGVLAKNDAACIERLMTASFHLSSTKGIKWGRWW
jgi:hypothetical protein